MPTTVTSLADLAGRELPFEFSGDGDDFNLCFVGSNGLLGVERGTVRFDSVDGATVTFSFSGSFTLCDGEGGQSPSDVSASGQGTAHAITERLLSRAADEPGVALQQPIHYFPLSSS